jgi:hypothetical protein
MRDYYGIGIDKVHSKMQAPKMARNFDFKCEGWILGSQKAAASLDEFGNKQLTPTGITFHAANNSLYIDYNIGLDCAYIQFNPTTIDSNNDFRLRHDFDYIIPKIQEQLFEAGILNADKFIHAKQSRLDPAIDGILSLPTELYIPSLRQFSNYSRGKKDLNYAHGITLGNQSQEIGMYNRSLHLTTNKKIDAGIIPLNVTRNELRLLNKGARTWNDKLQQHTIQDLLSLDAARIKDIHKSYHDRLRINLPPVTNQRIISHEKMLKNYQDEFGNKAATHYAIDRMHFEFVSQHGIVKTIEMLIDPSIKAKGGNNLSQARTHRRIQIDISLHRYKKLTEYEATQRELITEYKEMFA